MFTVSTQTFSPALLILRLCLLTACEYKSIFMDVKSFSNVPKSNESFLLMQHTCSDLSSLTVSHVNPSCESGGSSGAFSHLGAGG